MFDKLKNKFKNKKIENLISFLVILIITLIIINRILKNDSKKSNSINTTNTVELVKQNLNSKDNLEEKLENILSKMDGIGDVEVLITYSQSSSINPLYNENSSSSTTEENANTDNKKITQTQSNSKEILVDSSANPIVQATLSPKIEGAIITAQGAQKATIKADIVSAVEAATGLETHKIQVFEMKK